MSAGINRSKIRWSLSFMILGSLCGAGLALLYAPSSGERTRHYLRMKREWTRRRAGVITGELKETIDRFIAELKGITSHWVETGSAFTREARADLLHAIDAGKHAMQEERDRAGSDRRC